MTGESYGQSNVRDEVRYGEGAIEKKNERGYLRGPVVLNADDWPILLTRMAPARGRRCCNVLALQRLALQRLALQRLALQRLAEKAHVTGALSRTTARQIFTNAERLRLDVRGRADALSLITGEKAQGLRKYTVIWVVYYCKDAGIRPHLLETKLKEPSQWIRR